MRKLIKHLKPFVWAIVAIFVLLFAQAMADLSLPSYMANIVNVGIQQNGIENAVPQAISAVEFNKIAIFMTDSQKAQVTADYTLIDNQSADYTKYPKATTPVYELNKINKTEMKQLNAILSKAIPPVLAIEQNGLAAYGGNIQIPAGVDPFTVIEQLPPAQLAAIQSAAETQISAIDPVLLTQYSVAYISVQYKALGMSIGAIQDKYLFHIAMLMVLITLASAACSVTVGYISARIAAGVGRNMRKQLFVRVESFSNTEFDKFSTASLITRSTNDITQIQMLLVMLFRIVFYAPILGIGGILKVLGEANSMLWIIGAAVGALITIMVAMFVVVLPKFQSMQKLIDKLSSGDA